MAFSMRFRHYPLVIIHYSLAVCAFCAQICAQTAGAQTTTYRAHGAVGDGVTDDFDAIIKTHEAANKAGLKVRADAGATYYIGGAAKTAVIQTDTDWGDAKFIIDDRNVENRRTHVFLVSSKLPHSEITTIKTLKKNQAKLDLSLQHDSVIIVTDTTTMRYIRMGLNQHNGFPQTDVFVTDKKGSIDMRAPIIWDYDNITSMTARPIDPETLLIKGGYFTTIANQVESRNGYNYYSRGIAITRSNVVVDGLAHAITGELEHGSPYGGFIEVTNCAGVTVQNCGLSGRKTYVTIGSAGKPVSMGSYGLGSRRTVNLTVKNCKQLNSIHDRSLWGIFISDYSKNITFDNVEFSRFDAHMGVANATIRNCVLGHHGINLIGSGVFLVENTRVHARCFINLRDDYGSTWEGEIILRGCEFFPTRDGRSDFAVLVDGTNTGRHDFGYTCYMPEKITIDGLVIHDANPPPGYRGPKILAPFNKEYTSEDHKAAHPCVITREINIKNLKILGGKPWVISDNPFMFRNVKITEE